MEIVCWIILFLFSIWLLTSLFIVAYWVIFPKEWFWEHHKYIYGMIRYGAFFGCWAVFTLGVLRLLWFIPEGWTYKTEEGELMIVQIVQYAIAPFFGLCAAFFLTGYTFDKIRAMRRAYANLSTELFIVRKIVRMKEDLEIMEEDEREEEIIDYQVRLEKLDKLAVENKLTREQDTERDVLYRLLGELERRPESEQKKYTYEYYDNPNDHSPNAYGYCGTERENEELMSTTKRLTRAQRLILVLHYYDGMTIKEIAEKLDLSETCVSKIIARLKSDM